jgi:lysophospholipase L1-like esterase
MLVEQVKMILRNYRFAVVHFNVGLHGFGYTEDEYRCEFVKLVDVIKQSAPDAKLLWATSTPMRRVENLQELRSDNERVKARNKIVLELAAQAGIPVDDIYSLVENHPEYWANDGIHFKPEGQVTEGKQVAEAILKALTEQPR